MATGEVLERRNFSIETDSDVVKKGVSWEKSDKEIMREIQAIMRHIASSITYLPCLDDSYIAVQFTWTESDTKMVKLHSFDTKIHKVHTLVSWNDTTPFIDLLHACNNCLQTKEFALLCVVFWRAWFQRNRAVHSSTILSGEQSFIDFLHAVVSSSLGLAGVGAVIREFAVRVLVSSVAKLSGSLLLFWLKLGPSSRVSCLHVIPVFVLLP
ncbi:hypothetical protein Ddye_011572 [Dipteronia dyeriana]|uniref:Uncharacterized protein n=1 Tax=Dipteronia dyeriana TaxID=168575 RepID=A0AAE0CH74_9ROSI|nr:hypothetical protein Ddye_011572 [Dipteronia dyeriana]